MSETRYKSGVEKPDPVPWRGKGWERPGLADDAIYGEKTCPSCPAKIRWISVVRGDLLEAVPGCRRPWFIRSEHRAFRELVARELAAHMLNVHGAQEPATGRN
jgi:hypothetical protein